MKKILFLALMITIISCKKENPLIGNWYFDKELNSKDIYFLYGSFFNFNIKNDSILDFKSGFYHTINYNSSYYLGTETRYKIQDSVLSIYDKSYNDWREFKIIKSEDKILVLEDTEKRLIKLVKKEDNYFNDKTFDAIIVDRSPCLGSCSFNSTYINRNGEYYFKGYDYNTVNQNIYSKLDYKFTKEIFNKFDEIDVLKLKDKYLISASDSQTNTITFIKNGKIVKTIESYIECPSDLMDALINLSYAYQKVKLNPDNKYIFDNKVSLKSFASKAENYRLLESESFFLENEIKKGKKGDFKFQEKFELKFYEWIPSGERDVKTEIIKIVSDGRYFKFINRDKSYFVIDIGYNFIDRNPIIRKNREY